MRIRGIIVSLLIVCGIVFAGGNGHRTSCYIIPPVSRPPSASGPYQPPGYAASTVWYDGSWTNASGYIPDLSAQGTNYGYPNAGAGQPTPTNFPAATGNQCWYFDGGDGIMITNAPFNVGTGGVLTNSTIRCWAYRLNNAVGYVEVCQIGGPFNVGIYYNGGWGYQTVGGNISLGNPPASNWVCFTITESKIYPNSTFNVWTNGVHVITNAVLVEPNNSQTTVFAQIGRNVTPGVYFTGYVDELYRCSNYVWSGLEVTNDYNQMKATFGL